MSRRKTPIVALVYDFDGTLSPGNMQEFGFIQAIGKKPQEFWQESDDIASGQDASNILSYMKLMFDEARKAGIKLRREDFKRFGAQVELYDGVLQWFSHINAYGRSRGVKVEHYINSSGLTSMIEGTAIAKEFKRIFACSFIYNEEGEARCRDLPDPGPHGSGATGSYPWSSWSHGKSSEARCEPQHSRFLHHGP